MIGRPETPKAGAATRPAATRPIETSSQLMITQDAGVLSLANSITALSNDDLHEQLALLRSGPLTLRSITEQRQRLITREIALRYGWRWAG